MNPPTLTLTHPEAAWLALSFPLWLSVFLVLGLALALRGPLGQLPRWALARRAQAMRDRTGRGDIPIDPALRFIPEALAPQHMLALCLAVVVACLVALSLLAPTFLALALALPLSALLLWGLLWVAERRYAGRIDRALPAAVGRLAMQLRAGDSFTVALEKVTRDLDAGPLRDEWAFARDALNRPLESGYLATAPEAVAALGAQTPSLRHSAFLGHLEVALRQPQDAQVSRVSAAYDALLEAEQRRSGALTELAQMRYSGFAIGGAALFMFGYLALTQQERFAAAYSGPLGPLAGAIVGLALALPFVGGVLLARVEDLDY